jgi:hypothetical protein
VLYIFYVSIHTHIIHTHTHTHTHTQTYTHTQAQRHYRQGLKLDPEHKQCKAAYRKIKQMENIAKAAEQEVRAKRKRQKRPTIEAKETYYGGKRDLLWMQNRPTIESKETYYRGKRDLL